MKGFTISGGNGTYMELEDGRFADTVLGETSESVDAHEAFGILEADVTDWVGKVEWMGWSNYESDVEDIEEYVGAR